MVQPKNRGAAEALVKVLRALLCAPAERSAVNAERCRIKIKKKLRVYAHILLQVEGSSVMACFLHSLV